jgi:hypothetical protein
MLARILMWGGKRAECVQFGDGWVSPPSGRSACRGDPHAGFAMALMPSSGDTQTPPRMGLSTEEIRENAGTHFRGG